MTIVSREAIAHQDVQQEVSPALITWGPGIAYSRLLRFKSGQSARRPFEALLEFNLDLLPVSGTDGRIGSAADLTDIGIRQDQPHSKYCSRRDSKNQDCDWD